MREDLQEESIPDEPSAPTPADSVPAPDPFPAAASPSPFQAAAEPSPFHELDSRPHFFDEHGYQVSVDRQFWWNGGTWMPGHPPGSEAFSNAGIGSPNADPVLTKVQAAIAIGGLILFAGFAFSVCQSMPGSAFPAP